MHASIPTTYRGIRFRSRLEAKYACLFDLLGWSWEYEPLDLNGWIPDFVLRSALLALPSNTWKKTLQYDILFLGLYPYKTVSGRHLLGYHLDVPGWEPVFYDSNKLDAAWARATNTIQWKAPA